MHRDNCISRRSFLIRSGGLLAAASSMGASCSWQGKRPNILFILADDLGWNDISFNGSKDISTPNIDRILGEGVVLRNYYSYCVCTPSRAGILTGRYHWNVGVSRNIEGADGLKSQYATIADMLAVGGYTHRGYFGKWHLGMGSTNPEFHPMNHGFTEFIGFHEGSADYYSHYATGYPMGFHQAWTKNFSEYNQTGYATDLIAQNARSFMRQRTGKQPWFCFASFNAPHQPKQATPADLAATVGVKEKYPQDQAYGTWISDRQGYGQNNRQTHAAMVQGLDRAVGSLLEELRSLGTLDQTAIVFVSDNGGHITTGSDNTPLLGQKTNLYEGGVHCVAGFRWPGGGLPSTTKEITGTTAYIDWAPTLCDMAGVTTSNLGLDGYYMYNAYKAKNREIFFYEDRLGTPPAHILYGGVLSQNWKLISQHHSKLTTAPYRFNRLYARDATGRVDESTDLAEANPAVVQDLLTKLKTKTPYNPAV